jgi:hypothetical protein
VTGTYLLLFDYVVTALNAAMFAQGVPETLFSLGTWGGFALLVASFGAGAALGARNLMGGSTHQWASVLAIVLAVSGLAPFALVLVFGFGTMRGRDRFRTI